MKINIIGASGTGKTTLAKALAESLGVPHFDSDNYYHFPTDPPFQKQRSPQERAALLEKDLSPLTSWVLSGGAGTWDPPAKLDYSLIVFLYLPPGLRLERLRARESRLYGARISAGGDMEETHRSFMAWTAGYDSGESEGTNSLPYHQVFLASARCPVLRLEKPTTTAEQIQAILRSKEIFPGSSRV